MEDFFNLVLYCYSCPLYRLSILQMDQTAKVHTSIYYKKVPYLTSLLNLIQFKINLPIVNDYILKLLLAEKDKLVMISMVVKYKILTTETSLSLTLSNWVIFHHFLQIDPKLLLKEEL